MNEESKNLEKSHTNEKINKSILLNWTTKQAKAIRKLNSIIHGNFAPEKKLELIDNIDESSNRTEKTKEDTEYKKILQEIFDERRNDLLIEILHPFETGVEGTDSPYPKIDILDKSKDLKYTLNNVQGRIYHFEKNNEGQIKIQFKISNDRMRNYDELFLYSNFAYDEERKVFYPKEDKTPHLFDDLYYPYEYFFEIEVSEDIAIEKKYLQKEDGGLYVDDSNYYNLSIRDLGLAYRKREQSIPKKINDDIVDDAKSEIDEAINKALFKTVKRLAGEEITEEKLSDPDPKKINNFGKLVFVDDSTEHEAYGNLTSIDCPKDTLVIESHYSFRDYFGELFDEYESSKGMIYRVAFGNCITMNITYNASSKKEPNMLIFDAGVSEKDYNYSSRTIKDRIVNELYDLITGFLSGGKGNVYLVLSHFHSDHFNILDELSLELKKLTPQDKDRIKCIVPYQKDALSNMSQSLFLLACYKNSAKISKRSGRLLYSNNEIKVGIGVEATKADGWKRDNQRSMVIQLKNTLLPADSYYRYWPDKFAKVSVVDPTTKQTKLVYKKFQTLIAPHHGWLKKNTDIDRMIVDNIYDGVNTKVIVSRHDGGNDPTVRELMDDLGITAFDITGDQGAPISFVDP